MFWGSETHPYPFGSYPGQSIGMVPLAGTFQPACPLSGEPLTAPGSCAAPTWPSIRSDRRNSQLPNDGGPDAKNVAGMPHEKSAAIHLMAIKAGTMMTAASTASVKNQDQRPAGVFRTRSLSDAKEVFPSHRYRQKPNMTMSKCLSRKAAGRGPDTPDAVLFGCRDRLGGRVDPSNRSLVFFEPFQPSTAEHPISRTLAPRGRSGPQKQRIGSGSLRESSAARCAGTKRLLQILGKYLFEPFLNLHVGPEHDIRGHKENVTFLAFCRRTRPLMRHRPVPPRPGRRLRGICKR